MKPLNHYALEGSPSVYDEEAMTALELAGRTASKVNECVSELNEHGKIINDAVTYMTTNIHEATSEELGRMKNNGELADIIASEVFTDFDHRTHWVATPEQFGAVGDGVADDTNAVQTVINSGKCVVLSGTYKTTAPIIFPSNRYCILNGVINYTGTDSAVILNGHNIKIIGKGEINSNGRYCLRCSGSTSVYHCHIEIYRMYAPYSEDIILLECDNADYSVCCNMFYNILLHGENHSANGVHIRTSGNGYVNENLFDGLIYRLTNDAIKLTNNSPTWPIDGNRFLRTEAENSARQICVVGSGNGAMANVFELRSNEFAEKTGAIYICGPFRFNEIRVNAGISPKCFEVANGTYSRFNMSAEIPSNRLVGNLTIGGSTVSVNPCFAISDNNMVYKHSFTTGGCSAYLNSSYTVNYSDGVTVFPNQDTYLMIVKNDEVTDLVFDMNGKFAMRANFPFKIELPYTVIGKARFTLKDGDTVYIDAQELTTYKRYEVYATPNNTFGVREV